MQDKVKDDEIAIVEVAVSKNVADAPTNSVNPAQLITHAGKTNWKPERCRLEFSGELCK